MGNVEVQPKRSLAISVLAVLDFIGGLASFYFLAVVFVFRVTAKAHQYPPINYGTIIFYFLAGLIFIIVGWGLWSRKLWGYWGEIILLIANVVYDIFLFVTAMSGVSTIIQIAICIVILLYLLVNKRLRAAFHP